MSGKINRMKLEALAKSGKLNEETLARIGHVGRFYQRISKACPNPNLKISDVLTGDELQKFWNETADEGATIGRCPLVHQNAPTRPHQGVAQRYRAVALLLHQLCCSAGSIRPLSP